MATGIRFASDSDIEEFEPTFGKHVPKTNGSWERLHKMAMEEIEARLRARRDQPDQFELGRVGLRSRDNLRRVAAWLAIHFGYVASDDQSGSDDNFFARKASYYWQRAGGTLDAEAAALDYDLSNDGNIGKDEEQRPFVRRILRG